MAEGQRLDVEAPAHGWATVRLTAPGVALEFTASYTPGDSIGDLARSAVQSLAGVPEEVVTWNTEPVECEFRFMAVAGRTRLEVYEFPDARHLRRDVDARTALVEGDTPAMARAVWRGLRRLQGSVPACEFAAAWGHPFPVAAVERLGEGLRGGVGHEPAGPA
ncbi:hypothetical protein [Paludisphaera mucosa]|uniref:Uncharacterized protein n=1 Tax=Paludisphaera mucosa TaxID=3030827 RepID=A0ABT6FD38_9BACT|nr:hypothetical protein [Paludisphaera mucosa]MDG3005490.1 hypothetical protein [Paludisphaera mucosa]